MFPIEFKTFKNATPGNKIKDFLSKNYITEYTSSSIEKLLSNMNTTHTTLSNLNTSSSNIDVLSTRKNLIITYLKQLKLLDSKLPLSEIDFKFTWTDIIKKQPLCSSKLHFEYYNMLFNLAVLFFVQGFSLDKQNTNIKCTAKQCNDIWNVFSNALWCFNKIQNELNLHISDSETPADMNDTVLEYYCLLCRIYAFKYLIRRSSEKMKEYLNDKNLSDGELFKKIDENVKQRFSLANEIVEMYEKCYKIVSSPNFVWTMNIDSLDYFLFQKDFYIGLKYNVIYEFHMSIFDKQGNNFQNAIVYLEKKLNVLKPWESKIGALKRVFNETNFNFAEYMEKVKKQLNQMKYENDNIYKMKWVPFNEPEPEKINFFKPKEPEGFSTPLESVMEKDFEILMPKKINSELEKGKEQIKKAIESKYKKYMENTYIDSKLSQLKIPQKLKSNINTLMQNVNEKIWSKIVEIQKKGGKQKLLDLILQIKEINKDLNSKLKEYLQKIQKEANDDTNFRIKYGQRWLMEPSNKFNETHISNLQNYITRLSKSQVHDSKQEEDIAALSKQLEVLSLSKEAFGQRYPKNENDFLQLNANELKIQNLLDEIYAISEKNVAIINKTIQFLKNDEELIKGYLEIENKKKKEESFLMQQQEKYDAMLMEVKTNEKSIDEKIREIGNVCKDIENDPEEVKQKEEFQRKVQEFEKEVENTIEVFNNKCGILIKGVNYYKNEKEKIYNVINYVIRFLNKRNETKYVLLEDITKVKGEKFTPLQELSLK